MSSPASSPDSSSPSILVPDKLPLTVSIVLLSAAAVAWTATYYLMPLMTASNMMGIASIVSSLSPAAVSFFEFVWMIGMVAMMFPAMIPIVVTYNGLKTRFELDRPWMQFLATPLFLAGYLSLYATLGMGAFAAIYIALYAASIVPSLSAYALPAAAGILFVTGIWQLTPLKNRCLTNCVSPFGFFLMHAKRGLTGAFRMGAEHGYYCVGCCYLYMLVMLGVAAMSIPSMVLLAGLITIEKVLSKGARWFKWISAMIFVALALGLLLSPHFFGFS